MMPLELKPNEDGALDDYHVSHGALRVGQIYRRKSALRPEAQWLWVLNGVAESTDELALSGVTGGLDEAMAALNERWTKWLAWAQLAEVD